MDKPNDLIECEAIRYASCAVDPIEMAVEHPLTQKVVRFDFNDCEEATRMVETVASEFELTAGQVMGVLHKCNDLLFGGGNV